MVVPHIDGQFIKDVEAVLTAPDRANLPVLNPGLGYIYLGFKAHLNEWTQFNLVARTLYQDNMRALKRRWACGLDKPWSMTPTVWNDLVDMFTEFGPDDVGFMS
ncbi:En/Spm-like transposon protein-like [Arabidopsis thaliana]|uniref:En/Spm-like transposon protein-like n=1 Tax=Arabidopsis thaliana TaxID=3702 RepID=Q9LW39_ARATH|nr:En/Spm-like transposon protein-like [Arabidopsis thaliana]